MDYKTKIIELLNNINSEKVLKLIYEILLKIGWGFISQSFYL